MAVKAYVFSGKQTTLNCSVQLRLPKYQAELGKKKTNVEPDIS